MLLEQEPEMKAMNAELITDVNEAYDLNYKINLSAINYNKACEEAEKKV